MSSIASLKRDTTREILQRYANLEHAVAVVLSTDFSAQKIACGPVQNLRSGMQMTDVPYIHIYIYTYTIYCTHCCTVYVGLAQARPNKIISSFIVPLGKTLI